MYQVHLGRKILCKLIQKKLFLKFFVLFFFTCMPPKMQGCFSPFHIYKIISLLRGFQKEPPVAGFPESLSIVLGGMESGWRVLHWRSSVSRQPCTVEQPQATQTMADTGRNPLKGSLQKYKTCVDSLFKTNKQQRV